MKRGKKMKNKRIISLITAIPMCLTAVLNSSVSFIAEAESIKYEYGVFLGADPEEDPDCLDEMTSYKKIVLDAQCFSDEQIKSLQDSGHTVYSYINIGSLEEYRDYVDDYTKFAKDATLIDNGQLIEFKDIDVDFRFSHNVDINQMYDYMFSTFANTLCVYMANRMSAANGIEVRYPLLNAELVQFMDSIPLDMKFDAKQPKRFQKEMMVGIVPDYILYAKKRGFTPPFEFIWQICRAYKYKRIHSSNVFFNSMMADRIIDNLLK